MNGVEKKFKEKGLLSQVICFKEKYGAVIDQVISPDADDIIQNVQRNDYSSLVGNDLNNFLDELATEFFKLSKKDLLFLADFFEREYLSWGRTVVRRSELGHFVAINKKISFIDDKSSGELHYRKEDFSVVDCMKTGAEFGVSKYFPVLASSLCLAGLSNVIKDNCCHKVFIKDIAESNTSLNNIIKTMNDNISYWVERKKKLELSGIVCDIEERVKSNKKTISFFASLLQDPMQYGFLDNVKKSIPLLLPIPFCVGVMRNPNMLLRDKLMSGLLFGVFASGVLACLADSPLVQDGKSFAISVAAAGALSVFTGILLRLSQECFSDNSSRNGTVKLKDIAVLLENEKIKIAD